MGYAFRLLQGKSGKIEKPERIGNNTHFGVLEDTKLKHSTDFIWSQLIRYVKFSKDGATIS